MFSRTKKLLEENCELKTEISNTNKMINAVESSALLLEFDYNGYVIKANALAHQTLNYPDSKIIGKNHSELCPIHVKESDKYRDFWKKLRSGKPIRGTFERISRDGTPKWIEANYYPIIEHDIVTRIIKIGYDVTAAAESLRTCRAIVSAVERSQAVIEFKTDGTIMTCNLNFERAMGYTAKEIVGKHHRMFCEEKFYSESPDFWKELASGEFKQGKFKRINASGQPVWLEASYNPIIDDNGVVLKVIKIATDVTEATNRNDATNLAAELASATAEETFQVSVQGANALKDSIDKSESIKERTSAAMAAISNLSEQSKSIQNIVSTISEIASQTNLLALNAAIEAARAGDQGRGFAVVADEVRQLAARTSSSTEEIGLVVNENTALTDSAEKLMISVVEEVDANRMLIDEVSSVMEEIRKGAEDVSRTVTSIHA